MRNFRHETKVVATAKIDGVEVPIASHSYTAYEQDCEQCGKEYTSKGVMGGLTEIMFGNLCPDCRPKPQE